MSGAMLSWYLTGAIFTVGIWGVIGCANLVRKVIALSFANSAVILFFVLQAAEAGSAPPIAVGAVAPADPVPHALMLTAIVVGVCIIALALALTYALYRRHGTLDMHELERRIWSADE